ncbi:hypothetical protein [Ferrimonas balearica]|uniref:hypothetical protein n=1 Tax=Ferrimonas balearica TaxID=44012 RepID=UPI001C998126|nr:hypothetical protein [Ferrimonas balearica]MBY5921930.1 hypothetical protein [Ferrimonas balearica]MBY5994730.1 hypothetical protein [Ferrimonas balearica]
MAWTTLYALLGTLIWMLPAAVVARLERAQGVTQVLWILSAVVFSYLALLCYLFRPRDTQVSELRERP